MATKITSTYVRPNTGVEFPKVSDYNSDYDTWRRQYFTDNSVDIAFNLSGDELTLIAEIEFADEAAYQAWVTARDSDGRNTTAGASVKSDAQSRGITLKIEKTDDAGNTTTLHNI
tara:strand:+ start:247 stop:591 length:345 start_codon:yes stop_codon:yes gene_type:complete